MQDLIIGNICFRTTLGTKVIVSHAYCLETGTVYDFKRANELHRLYKQYS